MIAITFNGIDLAALSGVTLTKRNANQAPDRELRIFKKARADASVLTSAEYSNKPIIVEGLVQGDNQIDCETKFNTLLSYLQVTNADLVIDRAGISVTYMKTSLKGYSLDNSEGGFLNFKLMFIAVEPIALESSSLQFLQPNNIVASAATLPINVGGTYKALPIFTLTISSLTGGTTKAITIFNTVTGSGITVTRTWTAADILEVDVLNQTVRVNNGLVEYTGSFPSFDTGAGSVGYSDGLTTRSVVLSATYKRRYV
jgi:hypothetical protein